MKESREQRDKTMIIKLMFIPNDDTLNNPFCRLELAVKTLNLINQLIKIQ